MNLYSFTGAWAKLVVAKRILVLLMTIVLTIAAGFQLSKIYFEDSTDMWFLQDDPMLLLYQQHKELFQNDDYLVVAIEAPAGSPTVVNAETLSLVRKLTVFLEDHNHVTKVRSLSNYQHMYTEDGILNVDYVIPDDDETYANLTPANWLKAESILLNERLSRDLTVSNDLSATVISARIIENHLEQNAKLEVAEDFRQYLASLQLDAEIWKIHTSGSATINQEYFRNSNADSSVIYPIMLAMIVLLLLLIFRNTVGVLYPLLLVIFSIVLTLGITATLGWPLNILNISLPTLIIAIGLCDSIHILVRFYSHLGKGESSKEAAVKTVQSLFVPCFITTLTTFTGFLVLAISNLTPVVEFGIESAIGVLLAFILSVTALPAALSFVKRPVKRHGAAAKYLASVAEFAINNRRTLVAMFFLSLVPLTYWLGQIKVDTSFERNFKQESKFRQSMRFFDEEFTGALSIELLIDSRSKGGAKNPIFLQRVLDLQRDLERHEGTGRGLSLLDYLLEVNAELHDENPAYYTVPDNSRMVSQYLLLYRSAGPEEDLSDLISFEEDKLRMSLIFKSRSAEQMNRWIEEIEHTIAARYPDLNVALTGRTVIFNNMDQYVQNGVILSFSAAICLILIILFVQFKSVKYGLIAMVPSIFPILVAAGIMGLFNIYLDIATMMVAAITIGLAVDDSVHFLWAYIFAKRAGASDEQAVVKAATTSGHAILLTSLVLCCGFLVLTMSSFVPTIYLGLLATVIIVVAFLADIILVPALITFTRFRVFEEKPAHSY